MQSPQNDQYKMTLREWVEVEAALTNALERHRRINVSCQGCVHYERAQCDKFNATPPPDYVTGKVKCEGWEHDGIPF
jgi:hypothetical protein